LRNALIVVVYSSSRFVDHAGDARSIDPLRGSEMSSLFAEVSALPITYHFRHIRLQFRMA
jgi:hypothetical protein